MKCTSCKQGLLAPAHLDDLLPTHTCTHCGGNWIYLQDYLRWLGRNGEISPADTDYQVEAQETKQAMLCPKTGRLMLKYRISKNTAHKLDLSPEVNGIWLDKGEWELLKQEGLATRLNAVFTDPWQQNIRTQKTKDVLEALYSNEFGDEGYQKIKDIRKWLNTQPNKEQFLAYLLTEDPYSTDK
jgi:Zn-finger nucleic acid-binding protein